ncbi:MAG: M20/M25/M40 family metallo-hydrolase [Spirochaetia bacterium]|nr:M20/M25/M40 family metallo-hydrolase [Spirochaetia bacterium]
MNSETAFHHYDKGSSASSPADGSRQKSPQLADLERLHDRVRELCRIVAPSGAEGSMLALLEAYSADNAGFGCRLIRLEKGDICNLLLRISGTSDSEPFLISAHLDTVPLPQGVASVELHENDGILRSNGSTILGGDDRAGVALAMEMADLALAHPERHGGLEVLFTVREEVGCAGSAILRKADFLAAYGFNLDGESEPGSAIIRAPRKALFTCRITGRTAHAALAPEEGVHALVIAGSILTSLPMGKVDADTTVNIGAVSGGGSTNIVPDSALLMGEMRSFSESSFRKVQQEIDDRCEAAAAARGGKVVVQWEDVYPGYTLDNESPVVRAFSSACRRLNLEPKLLSSRGGGDTNNLNSIGIENIVFGIGMHNIHSTEEYLVFDELDTAAALLEALIFLPHE